MAELRRKKGVTMMEIVIVVALSSIIMTVAFLLMSRSNRQFKKGNDMISIQRLMDNIVERIRSDVRSLKYVKEHTDNSFVFAIVRDGGEVTVSYRFNPEDKTLYRSESMRSELTNEEEIKESDFHGAKQVLALSFTPEFNDESQNEFKHLNVALQIASNEYSSKEKDASTLSIACQFYSTCVESELKIYKIMESD